MSNACTSPAGASLPLTLMMYSQVIESGVAGLVGTLWSGARAAAREARELAAALELEKAGRRAASMLDSGIEVRTCIAGLAGQAQALLRAAVLHQYLSSADACRGKRARHERPAGKVGDAVAHGGTLIRGAPARRRLARLPSACWTGALTRACGAWRALAARPSPARTSMRPSCTMGAGRWATV